MKKVLVLGAAGMAGHVVATYLQEQGYDVERLARQPQGPATHTLDVTNTAQLRHFLQGHTFDVVVNCIGLLVKESEQRKDLAVYINSYLPRLLEEMYKDDLTRLIHLSTDCVFRGNNSPYTESSPISPDDFYGRSKALGEIVNAKDLTLRMSIIGPDLKSEGSGLFNWFFKQTGEITGYDKVIWSGITSIELAKGIKAAIEQNLTGLYHLVPKQPISKFDLLKLIALVFGRTDIKIRRSSDRVLDRRLVNTRHDFEYAVPDYKAMVEEMRVWVQSHGKLYPHY